MRTMINILTGILLYLLDREFRSLVNTKMKSYRKQVGPDDTVQAGESVVAVLSRPQGREVIE